MARKKASLNTKKAFLDDFLEDLEIFQSGEDHVECVICAEKCNKNKTL